MRGNLEVPFIKAWVDVLLALKDAAKVARDPSVFVQEMSFLGPREFARKYLPANVITDSVLAQEDILSNSMYEGARLAQDVAYCIEWGDPVVKADIETQVEAEPMMFAADFGNIEARVAAAVPNWDQMFAELNVQAVRNAE
jgi:hypothetical protein